MPHTQLQLRLAGSLLGMDCLLAARLRSPGLLAPLELPCFNGDLPPCIGRLPALQRLGPLLRVCCRRDRGRRGVGGAACAASRGVAAGVSDGGDAVLGLQATSCACGEGSGGGRARCMSESIALWSEMSASV